MRLKLLLIASVLCSVSFCTSKADVLEDGSGNNSPDDLLIEEEDDEASGGSVIVSRQPPSSNDDNEEEQKKEEEEQETFDENDENDDGNGGGGIFLKEDVSVDDETREMLKKPVPVKDNNLITHPGILAAIAIGGVLVLSCLVAFFALIVCRIRRKDEGTYNLKEAMSMKLKYVAYKKGEMSDKEFFA